MPPITPRPIPPIRAPTRMATRTKRNCNNIFSTESSNAAGRFARHTAANPRTVYKGTHLRPKAPNIHATFPKNAHTLYPLYPHLIRSTIPPPPLLLYTLCNLQSFTSRQLCGSTGHEELTPITINVFSDNSSKAYGSNHR